MKLDANDLRPGHTVKHKNSVWKIVKTQHVKPGKGGAYVQAELKNLLDGTKLNERFRSSDTIDKARIEGKEFQFMYLDQDDYWFMDLETYEQISMSKDDIGEVVDFLSDGMEVKIDFYEEKPVNVSIAESMTFEVIETDAVVKGQTASSSYKPAIIVGGVKIMVPPHIKVGDRITISTSNKEYIKKEN